jgi:hypothetical protein
MPRAIRRSRILRPRRRSKSVARVRFWRFREDFWRIGSLAAIGMLPMSTVGLGQPFQRSAGSLAGGQRVPTLSHRQLVGQVAVVSRGARPKTVGGVGCECQLSRPGERPAASSSPPPTRRDATPGAALRSDAQPPAGRASPLHGDRGRPGYHGRPCWPVEPADYSQEIAGPTTEVGRGTQARAAHLLFSSGSRPRPDGSHSGLPPWKRPVANRPYPRR